jgi:hypothetical protein
MVILATWISRHHDHRHRAVSLPALPFIERHARQTRLRPVYTRGKRYGESDRRSGQVVAGVGDPGPAAKSELIGEGPVSRGRLARKQFSVGEELSVFVPALTPSKVFCGKICLLFWRLSGQNAGTRKVKPHSRALQIERRTSGARTVVLTNDSGAWE